MQGKSAAKLQAVGHIAPCGLAKKLLGDGGALWGVTIM
jgi:hypothetical protein